MPSEAVQAKARRYLAEARLLVERVDATTIQARCRGQGAVYALGFASGEWWCSCPARRECAHLVALRLVTSPGIAARSADIRQTADSTP